MFLHAFNYYIHVPGRIIRRNNWVNHILNLEKFSLLQQFYYLWYLCVHILTLISLIKLSNFIFYREQLWITARKQGKKSASFFWVGSDVNISGQYPDIWKAYDGQVNYISLSRDWLYLAHLSQRLIWAFRIIIFLSPFHRFHQKFFPFFFILSTMRTIFTKIGTKHSWMKENRNCSILFQGEIIAKIVRIHLFIRKSSSPEPLDQFQSNWGEKIIIMRVQFCPNEMLHIFRKGFNAENKLTTFKNLLRPWEPSLS